MFCNVFGGFLLFFSENSAIFLKNLDVFCGKELAPHKNRRNRSLLTDNVELGIGRDA